MRAKKILASMISLALCMGAVPSGAVFAADNTKKTAAASEVVSFAKTAGEEAVTTTKAAATTTTTKAAAATTTTKAAATTTKAAATTTTKAAATTTTKAAATTTTTKAAATTTTKAAATTTTKAAATTTTKVTVAGTTTTTTTGGSTVITIMLGDVNGDKQINAVDASEVLAEYALISSNQPPSFTAKQILAADVNGDGLTDAVDASNILAYYAYLSTGGKLSLEDFLAQESSNTTTATTTKATTTTTTTTTATEDTTTTETTTTTTAPADTTTTTTAESTTDIITSPETTTSTTTTTTAPAETTTTTTADPHRVREIKLSKTEIELVVGGGGDISYVTILPVTALNKDEIWWSSDESVAIVDNEGWISPIGAGSCTVTVQSVDNPDVTAEIKVNVKSPNKVTEIQLSKTEIDLVVGGGGDIAYVTMLPSTAPNKEEKWWSSDESVAIVDREGWIIPVGEGTCTVTVQSVDNPYVTAEIKVTVTDPNKVKEIILSKNEVIIPVGGGDIVFVTMLPENASNVEEIWWSSNENIAIVDSEGWITGIAPGICTVTVQSVSNPSVTAEIRVIVSDDLANAGYSAAYELPAALKAMLPKKSI